MRDFVATNYGLAANQGIDLFGSQTCLFEDFA
jgi:hypothetical protein